MATLLSDTRIVFPARNFSDSVKKLLYIASRIKNGKAHPNRAAVKRACCPVRKRSAVKPGPHRDITSAQLLAHSLARNAAYYEGYDTCLAVLKFALKYSYSVNFQKK